MAGPVRTGSDGDDAFRRCSKIVAGYAGLARTISLPVPVPELLDTSAALVATADRPSGAYFIAQVQCVGGLERANQVKVDVLGWQVVEQPPPLTQQKRSQLDVDQVQYAGPQALLACVGAVQHHVTITCRGLGLSHARLDAVSHEVNPLERILRRGFMGRDEDRHAAVVIAAPSSRRSPRSAVPR